MHIRLAAVFVSALSASAFANPFEAELAAEGNTCWERVYDAPHLKTHPKQQVARIKLSTEVQDDGSIVASLGINLRKRNGGGKFDYSGFGYCKVKGAGIRCPSEWDAGSFSLEYGPENTLKIVNNGLIANPSNYDSEDVAPNAVDLGKSDDRVWLLSRTADEGCDLY